MEFLLILAILLAVVYVVAGPLRRTGSAAEEPASVTAAELEVAELEAAREAKYREIRDAELDRATGKLSDADFEALDAALRAEAVEILKQLDAAGGPVAPARANPAATIPSR